ncbi:MAG: serine hydrolase domain-containing protein [Anaerolineae bacterium]
MARVDTKRLQRAFDVARLYVEQGEVPSAVLAVGNREGLVRCEAFSGQDAAAPDSIYLLASISKPITATALMQLVEDGLLVLSEPLARYIPEFAQPAKPTVTAHHLLTHTSGMEEKAYWDTLGASLAPVEAFVRAACCAGLHFQPGSRYEYCTLSFFVLAELIARLSGMPYVDYLRERVLVPLGMVDTSFDPGAENPRAMPVRNFLPEPALAMWKALAVPGGGLWSTAADLVAFGRAFLNGGCADTGARLLAPATIDLMTRDHVAGLVEMVEGQPRPAHYGLGWGKAPLRGHMPGSAQAFEHSGATGTLLLVDPEWDLVYVFLTNRWEASDQARLGALQAVYAALQR